jgi:hypothetical protein
MKLFFAASSFALYAGVDASSVRGLGGQSKQELCHETPFSLKDSLRSYRTISVSIKAVEAHEKQGDLPGNCATQCEDLCNPSPDECLYHETFPDGDDCSCAKDPYYLCGQNTECSGNVCECESDFEELGLGDASDPNVGCVSID